MPFFITKHYPNFLKNFRWRVHIIRNKDGESGVYKIVHDRAGYFLIFAPRCAVIRVKKLGE